MPRAVQTIAMLALTAPLLIGDSAHTVIGAAAGKSPIDCTCRYRGQDFHLGESICLPTSAGLRLAQCQMVLNNTSWKITDRPCPTAAVPTWNRDIMLASLARRH